MNKIATILISLCSLALVLIACAESNTAASADPPTYSVIKSTGLYETVSVDAKQMEILSIGTKLVPADGVRSLFCKTIVEFDIEYELCEVESVDTGQTGWVLKKWISED